MNDYRTRYCAYCGGWGSGKSWAGARKLAALHLHNAFDASGRATYAKGLVVASTYGLAMTVNIPQLAEAFDEMRLSHQFISDPRRFCFTLSDLGTRKRPSEILVRSAEAPMTIAGFEVGHVWGDEVARWHRSDCEPAHDAFLQAEGRLREANARCRQMNLTFTHEGRRTRVFERFENTAALPGHVLYRSSTQENPHLPADWSAALRQNLSADMARQYLHGFAANLAASSVYVNFNPQVNCDAALVLDPARPLQLAIDFNINPGCHAIIGQHDVSNGRVTATHELFADRLHIAGLLDLLCAFLQREFDGWKFPGPLELFGDASGSNAHAATGESCWHVLESGLDARGIPWRLRVPRANPPVADRVNAVNCAFHTLDGQVRYTIHPRCHRLLQDFATLQWTDHGLDKRDRHASHASDADGYRVHYLLPIRVARKHGGSVGFSQ